MTIQQQLIALLTNSTDAATRIYPMTAPDNVVRPYITYQRIYENDQNVLSGSSGVTNTRMQIDVYADSYAEADSVSRAVAALLAAWTYKTVSLMARDLYEDAVKLYRVQSDYSIWH